MMAGIAPDDGSAFYNYYHRGSSNDEASMIANCEFVDRESYHQGRWNGGLYETEQTMQEKNWGADMGTRMEESSAGQAIFDDFLRDLRWPRTTTWFASSEQDGYGGSGDGKSSRASSDASSCLAFSTPPPLPPDTSFSSSEPTRKVRIERLSSPLNRRPLATVTTPRTPPSNTSNTSRRFKNPDLEAKRMIKLSKFLSTLRKNPTASLQVHNEKVLALYDSDSHPQFLSTTTKDLLESSSQQVSSMMQVAGILSRTADVSTNKGFIYTLLSWEIFRREELRLLREENVAGNLAARQVNQQMADLLKRGCKAKDWASDGRRAAEMVFRALKNLSSSATSSALILLGDVSSLDCMLKIAHFPILRRRFEENFATLVRSKAVGWEALAAQRGYGIFDFEEFLLQLRNCFITKRQEALSSPFVVGRTPEEESNNHLNNTNYCCDNLELCFQGMGTDFSSPPLPPVFGNHYWGDSITTPPFWWS